MSTKTTLKRIALVAVSALGFGVMSVVPANAAYTSAITLSTTSLTVVNGGTESSSKAGFFYIDTTELDGTTATADGLQSSGESLLITTTAWPTGGAATDLYFSPVTIGDTVASTFAAVADEVADTSRLSIPQGEKTVAS